MQKYRILPPTAALRPDPDPSSQPMLVLDDSATLLLLHELEGWGRVREISQSTSGKEGWVPLDVLATIEPSDFLSLEIYSEPIAGPPTRLEGRHLTTRIALGDWAKINVELRDTTRRVVWVRRPAKVGTRAATPIPEMPRELQLGANQIYDSALRAAQERTRIDAAALAAIIDAEASRITAGPHRGRWNADAINASTGAAGLTQFLASTWLGHARILGTALRERAETDRLCDDQGRSLPEKRDALLKLRFDATLSIISAAEYGIINLRGLVSKGLIAPGISDDEKAAYIYLAHHEGLAGAAGFISGARVYSSSDLSTQLGARRAQTLILASAGDANLAYRKWLTEYIASKIRPDRFRRNKGAVASPATPALAESKRSANPEEVVSYTSLDSETQNELRDSSLGTIPITRIGVARPTAVAVQKALSLHGYLDPPADGLFGAVSQWAITEFCIREGLKPTDGLTSTLRARLIQPTNPLPSLVRSGKWIDGVVDYLGHDGSFICRHSGCWNIVYIEGKNLDGTPNANDPNAFNDVRLIFSISASGSPEFRAWEATTEPGQYYTDRPLNTAGAARIAFRQFKSWAVGQHLAGRPSGHEALVQVKPVTVHRDLNRDFDRAGDVTFRGLFGINQHWGYDAPRGNINRSSAGCLVGREKDGHREFMRLLKQDARYKVNNAYNFVTAIIPGDRLNDVSLPKVST